jgi:hypothetical protein
MALLEPWCWWKGHFWRHVSYREGGGYYECITCSRRRPGHRTERTEDGVWTVWLDHDGKELSRTQVAWRMDRHVPE